jgi:hypothetical protein
MGTTLFTRLLVLGLLACSPAAANEKTDTDRSPAHQPTQQTLVAGTLILATTQDSLSSRRNRAGETLTALVSGDVEGAHGQVVIPAGSRVALRIVQLEPATNKSRQNGTIALDVTSLTVRGREYPVSIRVEPPHWLRGRGVTAGEVEKGSGGTVIGVVAARVIGGSSRGTVIGTTAASRDVVVPPGTAILFVLPQPLTVTTR